MAQQQRFGASRTAQGRRQVALGSHQQPLLKRHPKTCRELHGLMKKSAGGMVSAINRLVAQRYQYQSAFNRAAPAASVVVPVEHALRHRDLTPCELQP